MEIVRLVEAAGFEVSSLETTRSGLHHVVHLDVKDGDGHLYRAHFLGLTRALLLRSVQNAYGTVLPNPV